MSGRNLAARVRERWSPWAGVRTSGAAEACELADAFDSLADRLDEAVRLLRESFGPVSPCAGEASDHVPFDEGVCDWCGGDWPCLAHRVGAFLAEEDPA